MNLKLLKCLLGGLSLVGMASSVVAQTIEKGKSIQITVTGVPDSEKKIITGIYPVLDDGFITMPFVGKVTAAGSTVVILEKALESVFQEKGIYQNARFQVLTGCILECGQGRGITVGGQVKKPGPVPMVKNLTIHQAIQEAGGISNYGQLKRVRLTRNREIKFYDLNQKELLNIPLQKGDEIYVADKWSDYLKGTDPHTP